MSMPAMLQRGHEYIRGPICSAAVSANFACFNTSECVSNLTACTVTLSYGCRSMLSNRAMGRHQHTLLRLQKGAIWRELASPDGQHSTEVCISLQLVF